MGNSTMRFVFDGNEMSLVTQKAEIVKQEVFESANCYVMDFPRMKERAKSYFSKNMMFAAVPVGTGIFWRTFLQYIFPWIIDVSKVYCAIKIAQGFYSEKRMGAKDGDGGLQSMLTYGKWYILISLIPWGVELFDGIAKTMNAGLLAAPVQYAH